MIGDAFSTAYVTIVIPVAVSINVFACSRIHLHYLFHMFTAQNTIVDPKQISIFSTSGRYLLCFSVCWQSPVMSAFALTFHYHIYGLTAGILVEIDDFIGAYIAIGAFHRRMLHSALCKNRRRFQFAIQIHNRSTCILGICRV